MKNDIITINKSKELIISSDKINNLDFITKNEYNRLLPKNLTKNDKKAQLIINDVKLKGKNKKLFSKEAFITAKDN